MINRIAGLENNRKQQPERKPGRQRPLVTASDLKQIAVSAEQFITQYPAAAVAASFFAGVALAWWIKRK